MIAAIECKIPFTSTGLELTLKLKFKAKANKYLNIDVEKIIFVVTKIFARVAAAGTIGCGASSAQPRSCQMGLCVCFTFYRRQPPALCINHPVQPLLITLCPAANKITAPR